MQLVARNKNGKKLWSGGLGPKDDALNVCEGDQEAIAVASLPQAVDNGQESFINLSAKWRNQRLW